MTNKGRSKVSESTPEDKPTVEQTVRDNLILDTVIESLNHPFMVIDAEDYSILLANSAARRSMLPEVKTCYALSHDRDTPCDGSDHMCPLAEVKRTGNPVKVVHRHFDQDKNLRWVEVNAHPIFDEKKKVVRVIEYCLDITERKQAEDELRESEERYRSLFTNNHAVMLIIDPETADIVDVNPAACSFYGYTREELTTKKITDINTLSKDEVFLEMQRARSEERKHFYFRHRLAGGEIRDVEVYSGPIALGGKDLLYSIIHDISARKRAEEQVQRSYDELEQRVEERTAELVETNERLRQEIEERKRMEKALRNSERKYRALINEASDAIVLTDTEGNVVDTNKRALELFGYSKNELLRKNVAELHPKEVLERTFTAFKEAVQSGSGSLNDTKVVRKDGKTVPVDITGSVIQYGDQRVVQGFFRDITERKLTEEALRKSEKELRFLSAELLDAQEKERARFARELHDGIGQSLSTMKVRVETLAKIAKSDLRSIQVEDLENLVPMIRQTIEEIRNTSMDLRPSTLDSLGIVPTLDWFSREFQTTYPYMQIEKEIDLQETEVPDSLKIIIYRIVQEAFSNAARHSGAEILQISLAKTDGEIRLAVQDNGRGFNLEDLLLADAATRCFGLTSMKERAELSGGSFAIESVIGQGTTVRANWKV